MQQLIAVSVVVVAVVIVVDIVVHFDVEGGVWLVHKVRKTKFYLVLNFKGSFFAYMCMTMRSFERIVSGVFLVSKLHQLGVMDFCEWMLLQKLKKEEPSLVMLLKVLRRTFCF